MWNWKILYLDVTNVKFALCQSYGIVNIQPWTQYAHYEIGQGNLKAIKLKGIAFRKNFPNWARLTQCGSRIGIQMNSYQKILFFSWDLDNLFETSIKGKIPLYIQSELNLDEIILSFRITHDILELICQSWSS